jgi:hypothetical protein
MNISPHTLCVIAVVALTGCGGSQPPIGAYGTTHALSHKRTFKYTGSEQSFKVPAGVTHVTITAYGASGALGDPEFSGYAPRAGAGGVMTATIPVTPRETLAVFVGGSGASGGFNGGGGMAGQSCPYGCLNLGGGASDVRQGGDRLADRVVIAAGGGGGGADGGYYWGGAGGAAGGSKGASGLKGGSRTTGSGGGLGGGGGTGGSQRTGGKGGAGGGGGSCRGFHGTLGAGGAAGLGSSGCGANGGGGGGGYYGGGGGGAGGYDSSKNVGPGGGGGGGSSFAERRATRVKMTNDAHKDDGSIVISW